MVSDDIEAIQSLLEEAEADDERVDFDDLDPYLTHENNDVRARAVEAVLEIVKDHPERALKRKSLLLDLANHDYIAVSQNAHAILGLVVPEQPEEFKDDTETFIDAVTSPIGTIRVLAAKSFGAIAHEYPETLAPHADALVEILTEEYTDDDLPDLVEDLQDPELMRVIRDHDHEERQKYIVSKEVAANGLVEVARRRPEALTDATDTVLEATTNGNPTVAGAAIDILAELLEQGYDVPDETVSTMEDALEIDSVFVQARAIRMLGLLEATESVDAIETLVAETSDEDLRDLAEETAEWLRSQSESA